VERIRAWSQDRNHFVALAGLEDALPRIDGGIARWWIEAAGGNADKAGEGFAEIARECRGFGFMPRAIEAERAADLMRVH
jgi:hypothetical protein